MSGASTHAMDAGSAEREARLRLVAAILKYVGDEVGGEIGTDIEIMDPRVVLAKAEARRQAVHVDALPGHMRNLC